MSILKLDVSGFKAKADAADLPDSDFFQVMDQVSAVNPLMQNALTVEQFVEYARRDHTKVSGTGYQAVDDVISLPNQGVVVISGRPAHGKSSLMRNIALRKALAGELVIYISLEMSAYEEILCFLKSLEGIERSPKTHIDNMRSLEAVASGESSSFLTLANLMRSNLFLISNIAMVEQITDLIGRPECKGARVFIDYAQIIKTTTGASQGQGTPLQLQEICQALRATAIQNELLIFLGSQLTPSQTGGSAFSDVPKGGRVLEEVASVLLRVWRQGVKSGNVLDDTLFKVGDADFTVSVEKNRFGKSNLLIGLFTEFGIILRDPSERSMSYSDVYDKLKRQT